VLTLLSAQSLSDSNFPEAAENALFPEAEQILADQLEDLMDQMVALKQHLTISPQQ
jgi:hypothetical protein